MVVVDRIGTGGVGARWIDIDVCGPPVRYFQIIRSS
jgi:hypothetical protein